MLQNEPITRLNSSQQKPPVQYDLFHVAISSKCIIFTDTVHHKL